MTAFDYVDVSIPTRYASWPVAGEADMFALVQHIRDEVALGHLTHEEALTEHAIASCRFLPFADDYTVSAARA